MVLRMVRAEPLPGYRPLRDPEFFRQVQVDEESRSVVRPNGLDFDPEVLHGDAEPARSARMPERVTG